MAYIGIDANGNRLKVAYGQFTTQASNTISLGFKPKKIIVSHNTNSKTFFESAYYSEEDNINYGVCYGGSGSSSGALDTFITEVNDNGFVYEPRSTTSSFQGHTAYYIAIG